MNRTIYFNNDNAEFLESQDEPWSRVVNRALDLLRGGSSNGKTSGSKPDDLGSIPKPLAKKLEVSAGNKVDLCEHGAGKGFCREKKCKNYQFRR